MLRKLAGGRHPLYLPAALLLGFCIFLCMDWERIFNGRNDFVHFYIGGILAGTPDLFDRGVNEIWQSRLIGAVFTQAINIRLPFYALLMKPLTALPYMSAYLVFQLFSLGCVILFLTLRFRHYPDVVLLALMFPPLWANFLNGQDVGLLLAFSSMSLWLASRGRDFAAGLVLSLCAIKLHLFLAVPMAIIFHDRRRLMLGGLTGGVILFTASLYSGGKDFIARLLAAVQVFNPQPDVMPNMRILYYPFLGDSSAAMVAAAILISGLTGYLAWKAPDYETAFGYCLLGGLMMGVHGYMQDCLLILLAATLVIPRETSKAVKILLGIAVTPLPYFFLQNGSPYSFVFGCLQLSILVAGARHYYMASRRETPGSLAAAQG